MDAESKTGIEIKAGFFPLGWFFFFFPPIIEIDGIERAKRWGTHFFEVEPGRHTVHIFIKYFYERPWPTRLFPISVSPSIVGDSSTQVTVDEGRTVSLKYYMPPSASARPPIEEVQK